MVEAGGSKERLDINIVFHKCRVHVKEATMVYVEFVRAGKSMKTKKVAITPEQPEVRFGTAGKVSVPKSSFYKLADGTFKPDITTSTLFCGTEKVGTVTFDLVS